MKNQPITIQTEEGPLVLQPAEAHMLDSFRRQWPMGLIPVEENGKGHCAMIFQQDSSEVWGVKFQCVDTNAEEAGRATEIRRVLIAVALAWMTHHYAGTIIPCAYLKQKGPDSFEHGLVVFMPPLPEKRMDPAYFRVTVNNYGETWPALHDLDAASIFIQLYQHFREHAYGRRESFIGGDMRPRLMMGEVYFDFMLLDGKLTCLLRNPAEDLPCWTSLRSLGETTIPHFPAAPAVHLSDPALMIGEEDFLEMTTIAFHDRGVKIEIIVPEMICTVSDGKTSIGWDGRIWVQPVGCGGSCPVDPRSLKKLDRKLTSLDVRRNRALWKNRHEIVQQACPGFMFLKGRLISETEARNELARACVFMKNVLARKVSEEEINGHRKKLMRLLNNFCTHPDRERIRDFQKRLGERPSRDQQEEILQQVLNWTGVDIEKTVKSKKAPAWPPSTGGVPFINNTNYRKPKLLVLYRIACSLTPGVRYSRDEIVEKIEAVRATLESNRKQDLRFHHDQLLRDMIDIGYIADDGRRTAFWRKDGPRP